MTNRTLIAGLGALGLGAVALGRWLFVTKRERDALAALTDEELYAGLHAALTRAKAERLKEGRQVLHALGHADPDAVRQALRFVPFRTLLDDALEEDIDNGTRPFGIHADLVREDSGPLLEELSRRLPPAKRRRTL